ncbi:phosphotransferase enzyme family protein [uncultured Cellulomonas sp.]|uniref:phosphotransferase enzyme family protein n=1 Tax=uncultured Cellulomonas sp. TaxID=189682 RepID=UPI002605F931|nr:phosphotransferase [uncultured Cellulomonas sp.]
MSLTLRAPASALLAPPAPLPARTAVEPPVQPPAALVTDLPGALDPLPLPAATWGAPDALDAVAEAALVLPLTLSRPRVVSALTTVVLRAGRHAVKVYPPGTDPAHLARTTAALAGTATALLPVAAPVVTSSGVVSVSPWLGDARPVGWAATGAVLRAFHDAHADADVPDWDPLRRLVALAPDLPDDAAGVLLDAREALLRALRGLHSPLGVGVVHGDLSPANVMRRGGHPVLIDLDFVARAPREYDLTSAARRFVAGELDAATYRAFCDAYGADVLGWDGRGVLDRIALLGGVAFRLWDDRRRGAALDWLDAAVREWRTPV